MLQKTKVFVSHWIRRSVYLLVLLFRHTVYHLFGKRVFFKKRIISNYYKKRNIHIGDILKSDIDKSKQSTLIYISYAIKYLLIVKGIDSLLEKIATFDSSQIDADRNYHNLKTEFQSFYFVNKILKLKILEIDNPNSNKKLTSPNAQNDIYTCDIKAKDLSNTLYFEVKDFSDMFETNSNSLPRSDDYGLQVEKWIIKKCKRNFRKGMNYLIARIDLETPFGLKKSSTIDYFYDEFIKEICNNKLWVKKKISRNEYIITSNFNTPNFFYSVYLVYGENYLKLNFQNG